MDKITSQKKGPLSAFSVILLFLMLVVTIFLFLIQNIDQFSSYFGSTTFKIVFDVSLLALFTLLVIYVFHRSAAYHRELEGMVERLQKSNQLLHALNSIQSNANASLDAQTLLSNALEVVMPVISSIGTIYIMDEETSSLRPLACYGIETPLEELPEYSVGEGLPGRVVELEYPLDDGPESVEGSRGEGTVTRNAMYRIGLPIKTGNKVIGVMMVGKYGNAHSQEERTLLNATTEVLGNSLTNAKLYDITRRALDNSRRTQNYLESLLNEAKIGVLVLDENGVVLIANREAELYLHVQIKDILSKNVFEALNGPGWRSQRLAQAFESSLNHKQGSQFSHPINDDPASLLMMVSVFPLFREKEELIGAAATFVKS